MSVTVDRPVAGPRKATGVRVAGIVHRTFPAHALGDRAGDQLLDLLPELDVVLLASASGCRVAQRGVPSRSFGRPGPAAPFGALRIADGLCRRGELGRAALFVEERSSAVALRLGVAGDAAVTELEAVPVARPTLALADMLYRHPGIRVYAGASLTSRLAGTPYEDRVSPVAGGLWAGLARLWPLRERVLLAELDVCGGFHSCVVVPRGAS